MKTRPMEADSNI